MPTGPIYLYFNCTKSRNSSFAQKQLLAKYTDKKDIKTFDAHFEKDDSITGTITLLEDKDPRYNSKFGEEFTKTYGRLDINIKEVHCFKVCYVHPEYQQIKSKLLKGAEEPPREVQDHAIYSINRRPFQGEQAIRIVERVLGIDSSVDPVYNFGRNQNRNGQFYGGYKNNHAVYGDNQGNDMNFVGR